MVLAWSQSKEMKAFGLMLPQQANFSAYEYCISLVFVSPFFHGSAVDFSPRCQTLAGAKSLSRSAARKLFSQSCQPHFLVPGYFVFSYQRCAGVCAGHISSVLVATAQDDLFSLGFDFELLKECFSSPLTNVPNPDAQIKNLSHKSRCAATRQMPLNQRN